MGLDIGEHDAVILSQLDYPAAYNNIPIATTNIATLVPGDAEPCPFHVSVSGSGHKVYSQCCKAEHAKRVAKANRRRNTAGISYMYDPVEVNEGPVEATDLPPLPPTHHVEQPPH